MKYFDVMNGVRLVFLWTALAVLSSCVSLNTVSLTSIPAQRNNVVKADASRVIFLGFNFDNDFVDTLETQLKEKCPDGIVSGILTKDEVVDYFLFIVWKHHVTASGYCSKAYAKNGTLRARVPGSSDDPADDPSSGGPVEGPILENHE